VIGRAREICLVAKAGGTDGDAATNRKAQEPKKERRPSARESKRRRVQAELAASGASSTSMAARLAAYDAEVRRRKESKLEEIGPSRRISTARCGSPASVAPGPSRGCAWHRIARAFRARAPATGGPPCTRPSGVGPTATATTSSSSKAARARSIGPAGATPLTLMAIAGCVRCKWIGCAPRSALAQTSSVCARGANTMHGSQPLLPLTSRFAAASCRRLAARALLPGLCNDAQPAQARCEGLSCRAVWLQAGRRLRRRRACRLCTRGLAHHLPRPWRGRRASEPDKGHARRAEALNARARRAGSRLIYVRPLIHVVTCAPVAPTDRGRVRTGDGWPSSHRTTRCSCSPPDRTCGPTARSCLTSTASRRSSTSCVQVGPRTHPPAYRVWMWTCVPRAAGLRQETLRPQTPHESAPRLHGGQSCPDCGSATAAPHGTPPSDPMPPRPHTPWAPTLV